jgi:hypothetical protein
MFGLGPYWTWALVAFLIGVLPGLFFFPWIRSPFAPGLWKLSTPMARVLLTVAQFLRGRGIMVKRANGRYEIGKYDEENQEAILSDKRVPVDPERTKWGLFGKKPFGITWEKGTDLHNRVSENVETDGGDGDGEYINMAAVHRILRGANDADAITRTEEHAKAEYGGGTSGISDLGMAILIMVMLLLGSATAWFVLGV